MRLSIVAILAWAFCATVSAAPISSCVSNAAEEGFTCNLYHSLADGTPSPISSLVDMPGFVTGGYLILLATPAGSETDPATWSDVVQFGDGSGFTNQVRLIGSAAFTPGFTSSVVASPARTSILRIQSGTGNDYVDFTPFVTSYGTGHNYYNIFSAAPAASEMPEPATWTLFAAAGAAFLLHRRLCRD